MTNEERWQVEGKTREALRDAKRNVVALKIRVEEYAKTLSDASELIRNFVNKPFGVGPTGMTGPEYVVRFCGDIIPGHIQEKIRELEKESGRVIDLEQKMKEFES
jgi:hypothetical protein